MPVEPSGTQEENVVGFSVSPEKRVVFAPGNLTPDGLSFEENQWDFGGLFDWSATESGNTLYYSDFTDWGNRIEGGWRTLTIDEWMYLFERRDGAKEKKGIGNVDGIGGLILLPDVWKIPEGQHFVPEFAEDNNDWSINEYTLSDWKKMESAGAVFLPAAGDGYGVSACRVAAMGFYWSSSSKGPQSAQYIFFYSYYLAESSRGPGNQYSVRLVHDVVEQ
ncbi:MAG: hypothetical protein IKG88_00155 [Bacteroidales bacterium]|nr:hypothetical protein [Bacteroidales bacterium]